MYSKLYNSQLCPVTITLKDNSFKIEKEFWSLKIC